MSLAIIDADADIRLVHRIPHGEARREADLRDLIAAHPALLPVHDIDPSYGTVATVTIELSIPGVGFVDVLLIDENGRLIVVECKLWRNPQARREVVGQILDYARELSRYGYEDLQRQVSIATKRQGNVLYDLARKAGSILSEADFVDRVSRDLAAGRFLLLVVGDGIAEGTQRIGEYLRDQPGLAFSFGLVEFAEYRCADQTIVHPRILAQTVTVERHVIRSEVPGITIDAVMPVERIATIASSRGPSDTGAAWKKFSERLIAEMRFDDPGQPQARNGGVGWVRVPLPANLYVNVYRSSSEGGLGAQIRFSSSEGAAIYSELRAGEQSIAEEFISAGLDAPQWRDDDVASVSLTHRSPQPWDEASEAAQREWMAKAANQFVNSFRPRLQRLA